MIKHDELPGWLVLLVMAWPESVLVVPELELMVDVIERLGSE